jgi:ABC-2 type transport system ATP-binding protein
MSTLATLRDLHKAFGTRVALSGLDLEIQRGEVLGLLGPNGAGKSTTIRMLSGLDVPARGTLTLFDGGRPTDARVRRRVGVAPQELALYPALTAEENLRFFGGLYGLRGEALGRAVAASLELAGLADRRRDRVATFSGGMQRRLNLACAVVHGPELVLLDEPTVGVDPQSRAHLMASLERLREGGATLVYSTHYMEEAERLCDRIAIVEGGRVLSVGTLAELLARHGGETRTVTVGPSLETVFLGLTGRSLRD